MHPSRGSRARRGALAVLLATGLGFAACGPFGETGADTTPGSSGDVGSVSFELTLGGKYQFDSLSYDISGNGFHRAATVNVAGSSSFSTLVSGVPAGSGYVAALTAQDAAGKLTPCTGSATFSVTSAGTAVRPRADELQRDSARDRHRRRGWQRGCWRDRRETRARWAAVARAARIRRRCRCRAAPATRSRCSSPRSARHGSVGSAGRNALRARG